MTMASVYEINQWSSQGPKATNHRPEHVVLVVPVRLEGISFSAVLRLKSRRAVSEMVQILENNADDVWCEDGSLRGPKGADGKRVSEDQAPPDPEGVRVTSSLQLTVQKKATSVRLLVEAGDTHVAVEMKSPEDAMEVCSNLYDACISTWGDPAEDEEKGAVH
jgi:hypothetical protein